MVDTFSPWIAATQRLVPTQVRIHSVGFDAQNFVVCVPARSYLWYCFFFVIVWGICLTIAIGFCIFTEIRLISASVASASIAIGSILSLERKIELHSNDRRISVSYRLLAISKTVFRRIIECKADIQVKAHLGRDVDGIPETRIDVLKNGRLVDILLTFEGGARSYPDAIVLAGQISSILECEVKEASPKPPSEK